MRTRNISIALMAALVITQMPVQRVNAQAALVIPGAAAIVIIGGIAYYVWINSEGLREQVAVPSSSMPMIDDPDDEGEWGVYKAKDAETCRWLAAGREHEWLGNGRCKIKG